MLMPTCARCAANTDTLSHRARSATEPDGPVRTAGVAECAAPAATTPKRWTASGARASATMTATSAGATNHERQHQRALQRQLLVDLRHRMRDRPCDGQAQTSLEVGDVPSGPWHHETRSAQ